MPKSIKYADVGRLGYEQAYELQHALNAMCKSGEAADMVVFTEHPHVYTLGRRSKSADILIGEERQRELGVTVFQSDRGGETTYHGPGQIVVYPIWNMKRMGFTVRSYVLFLEAVVTECLSSYGIKSHTIKGSPGVYVTEKGGLEVAKIASIGVRITGGVTLHGFALNVSTDLSYFDHIVPCGAPGMRGASIHSELAAAEAAARAADEAPDARKAGDKPSLDEVAERIRGIMAAKLGAEMSRGSIADIYSTECV